MKNQKLILSPKDNLGKIVLEDVTAFSLEGDTLLVVFNNGSTRNYPLVHLWYYSSHVDYHQEKLTTDKGDDYFGPSAAEGAVGVGEGVGFIPLDDGGIFVPDSDDNAAKYREVLERYREVLDRSIDEAMGSRHMGADQFQRGLVEGWKKSLLGIRNEFLEIDEELDNEGTEQ